MNYLNCSLIKKTTLSLFGLLLLCISVFSQNPIVPPGMYIADPEAHVWNDGKIYIYGSRDESDDYWCSHSYHILGSSNLKDWDITENAFSSKGEFDQVTHHNNLLFAPDVAYKNGLYYLYYCSPGKPKTEGVAVSKSANGPFINGKQIKGANSIDPAVLIDSDGQAYYYWGQGKPKVAKLKSNMIEIDATTIIEPLDKKGNNAFHEGSSIRRIGELYYFVFADESRNGRPTCLGYAIGKSPLGPFEYKGIIIDNIGCDPASWNNHGSIEKFNNQWYVFYHRSTNNSRKYRKTCIEPIFINEDGTINEVEMTSQGASEPLACSKIIEAEWACKLSGNVRIASISSIDKTNEGLTEINHNDTAVFKYLNFEKNISTLEIKTSSNSSGIIEVRLDSLKGKLIGQCNINSGIKNIPYQINQTTIKNIKEGKHAVYFTFKTKENQQLTIDWFRFF